MRKLYVLFIIAGLWASCCPQPKKDESAGSSLAPSETKADDTEDWPYQPQKRMDWEKGNSANVPVAMNVLKSYEVKDFISMKNYLADTVEFLSSRGNFKGTRKETVKFLQGLRGERTDVKIEMNNYGAFKNKTRNEDWVTLWYTEHVVTNAGVPDSSLSMDEYKIVNGKVALIDTKSRKLGK